jgi:hypothetical protein
MPLGDFITSDEVARYLLNGLEINESTCVARATYDDTSETLTIAFQKRGTYRYFNFSLAEYINFAEASSRGQYFNLYIRDQYPYERVN